MNDIAQRGTGATRASLSWGHRGSVRRGTPGSYPLDGIGLGSWLSHSEVKILSCAQRPPVPTEIEPTRAYRAMASALPITTMPRSDT